MVAIEHIEPADCPTLQAEPLTEVIVALELQPPRELSLVQTARQLGIQTVQQFIDINLCDYPEADDLREIAVYVGVELFRRPARKVLHTADWVLNKTFGIERLGFPI